MKSLIGSYGTGTFLWNGHGVRVFDWVGSSVPVGKQWRAFVRIGGKWVVHYGETREAAVNALLAEHPATQETL